MRDEKFNYYLENFEVLVRWMQEDIERSIFDARANFLVAMGLMNYTEILGSFLIGHYQKNAKGEIKKNIKGYLLKTTSTSRFNAFLEYMGVPYKELKNKHDVYGELRCGLTHEYVVKNRDFTIWGHEGRIDDVAIDNLRSPINQEIVRCGVIYENSQSGKWHIINPKYYLDFKRAGNRLIEELKKGQTVRSVENFIERSDNTNLLRFIVK